MVCLYDVFLQMFTVHYVYFQENSHMSIKQIMRSIE